MCRGTLDQPRFGIITVAYPLGLRWSVPRLRGGLRFWFTLERPSLTQRVTILVYAGAFLAYAAGCDFGLRWGVPRLRGGL